MDSIFTDNRFIKAGYDTNNDGIVDPIDIDPQIQIVERDKIENIKDAEYLFLWGRIKTWNSENEESVKFYSIISLLRTELKRL